MRKLMTGDIRRGSKSRMRRWRKFTCDGTPSTVSGTTKSCPTLVLLFLNTALGPANVFPTGADRPAQPAPAARSGSCHPIFLPSPPLTGVIRDSAGNLYGTTNYGGKKGGGVVFKLKPQ